MPVSTSHKGTCPNACPLKAHGCYASAGHLNIHWTKVSNGERGGDWSAFLAAVKSISRGEMWRHNQAGDLVGANDCIDRNALVELVNANKGKRGYSYTHYPLTTENIECIQMANANGFALNVSTNHIDEVDSAIETGLPVVTILPEIKGGYKNRVLTTAKGNKVLVCPNSINKTVTCKNCQLCLNSNRKYAIGFEAHGVGKKGLGI